MPIITPKGGVMRLPADSTAGKRGDPRELPQSGGTHKLPAEPGPPGQEIGSDVRGGSGDMYPNPLRVPATTPGSGTGQ